MLIVGDARICDNEVNVDLLFELLQDFVQITIQQVVFIRVIFVKGGAVRSAPAHTIAEL